MPFASPARARPVSPGAQAVVCSSFVSLAPGFEERYVRNQQNFNQARFPVASEVADFKGYLHGQIPYWNIPSTSPRIRRFGQIAGTAFSRPDGTIRIYAHYADAGLIAATTQTFGPPQGYLCRDSPIIRSNRLRG